ncbi:PepSY domain-containing protein [Novosphingopyxis sp. YJ-S2-01]|uniref:PepSY domain-containing protein n=1 Tax=Novosphingopyxis sp. YJ-S2-01 TaxID=2794021 RepID=UPI002FC394A5
MRKGRTPRMMALRKCHVRLGWLIGVPLILWTGSGLFMAAAPIERVRGAHLRSEAPALPPITPIAPMLEGRAADQLQLLTIGGKAVWVVAYKDGGRRRADPADGALLPAVGASEASAIARAARRGDEAIVSVTRSDAQHPPLDLRRERPAWAVQFADGARFYIDADTGELMAVRTRLWRWFDFLWGLHIMDLQTREDVNNPLLVIFAALAFGGMLIGSILMFRRRKARPRTEGKPRAKA